MSNNTDAAPTETLDVESETRPIRNLPMKTLVFGCDEPRRLSRRAVPSRPVAVRKFRLKISGLAEVSRLRGAIVCLVLGLGVVSGCATGRVAPVAVESVGELSASASHVTQAAVHEDTDLSVAFMPAGGDADEAAPVVAAAPEAVEAPAVETKVAHGF